MSGIAKNIDISKVTTEIRKEIENAMLQVAEHLTGVIQSRTPVGSTSHLRGSFFYAAKPLATGVAVEFGSPLEYGQYVEFGTKPHWAPIEEIARWVEAKLQPHVISVGVKFENGRALPTRAGTKKLSGDPRQKAIMKLAYAIQAKIAKHGTKGQGMIAGALKEVGMNYSVVEGPGGLAYSIDFIPVLEKQFPQLLNKIKLA